ncbi:hypothetical protein GOP47_0001217 [Adiantum capillus-veneris]|uniref:Uncharacterized protein n=1 Tax=Adiantum capillus-veneris TaxID=13818 RepID=A0A9D4VEZ9_ADICA|nr:hypothetical protein GOP47_0001217 [Adiantum capillus-veneris]
MAGGSSRWVATLLCWALLFCACASAKPSLEGTIIFSTYRRLRFAFDIYCVQVPSSFANSNFSETRLTYGEGQNVNYNGFFARDLDQDLIFKGAPRQQERGSSSYGDPLAGKILAYVSEQQEGRPQVYFNLYSSKEEVGVGRFDGVVNATDRSSQKNPSISRHEIHTAALQLANPNQKTCANAGDCGTDGGGDEDFVVHQPVFFQDRPSIAQDRVFYVSSQEQSQELRQSWAATYSTSLINGSTMRLTPGGVVDFSPSVSPSGEWMLVASSYGKRSWEGDAHELYTDLYIFNASDGSSRTLLVSGGGWPSWADDSTFFFHRKAEDGWWSIYKGVVAWDVLFGRYTQANDVVTVKRVTPPGVHCFTPAASAAANWVAIATRRPESSYRHVEIFDLQTNSFFQVTNQTAPTTHHYNPFVSHDSALLGYHKCRGSLNEVDPRIQEDATGLSGSIQEIGGSLRVPHLDSLISPSSGLSILRTGGEFPSFSPDGSYIAYISKAGETGVRAMRSDGSGSTEVYPNSSFGTVWDRVREGVIYTSSGPIFHSRASVHIVAMYNAHKLVNGENVSLTSKVLTKQGTRNNAFPSPSPDGKYLVFRSSRSGSKNLYIMDAVQGEEGGLWHLTQGKWTDTMCSWSPDGEWIVFSSDRENPGSGNFSLYLIHPNGTGLRKVFSDVHVDGRANHASFSPDSKYLLFTTDYAGFSSEPIGLPFQYQGYGDIFVSSLDGTYLERITHLQYENGTPSWGVRHIDSTELTKEGEDVQCAYDDVDWLLEDVFVQLQMPLSLPTQARCGYAG